MRGISIFAFAAAIAATVLACSSSSNANKRVGVDAQAFCNLDVNTCGDTSAGTVDECVTNVTALRFSQACANLIAKATCSDLAGDNTNLETTCFPACSSPGTFTCNLDNTISQCNETSTSGSDDDGGTGSSSGRLLVVDCAAGCQSEGSTYTGTCGTSYQGQTADHAQCWCD